MNREFSQNNKFFNTIISGKDEKFVIRFSLLETLAIKHTSYYFI